MSDQYNSDIPRQDSSWTAWLYGVAAVLLMGLSPMSFLALGWLLLARARPVDRLSPWPLALVVLAMAFTYASRRVGVSPFDDFSNVYYPAYLAANAAPLEALGAWDLTQISISTLEIGWPAILFLVALLPGTMSPAVMIFFITALSAALYAWWLRRYLLPLLPASHQGAAAILCLALFSFGLCSQLVRQMLCIPFLLAALWDSRFSRSLLYAIMASAFHLSAAPVWIIAMLLRYGGGAAALMMIVPLIFLMQEGTGLAGAIVGLDPGVFDKLRYYTDGIEDAAGYDITFLPLVLFVAFVGLFVRHHLDGRISLLLLVFAALFIALLPFPLASFRMTLFITAALVAPTICLAAARRMSSPLFTTMCVGLGTAMMLRRLWSGELSNEMALWDLYSPIDSVPYYYVARLLGGI